jgi:hypothetical protein
MGGEGSVKRGLGFRAHAERFLFGGHGLWAVVVKVCQPPLATFL